MNPYLKQLLITIGIYGSLIGIIALLSWTSAHGGVPILILGVPIISGIILCKSIFRIANKKFEFTIPLTVSATSLVLLAYQLEYATLFSI